VILVLIYLPLSTQAQIIDQVVAIVGDRIVTQYDIETFDPKRVKEIMAIENKEIRKKVLNKYYNEVKQLLIDQIALEIAAEREGVKITDEEVDAALDKVLKQNNITMSQLEVLLLKEKMTLPKYKLSIKQDMFQTRLKSRIIAPKIVLTQEDINKKVDEMAEELGIDDQFELRIITIPKKIDVGDVKDYIRKHGFADAAIKFSIDKSAKKGGYIGWIKVHSLSKELQDLLKDKTYKDIVYYTNNDGKRMLFYIEGFRSKYDIDGDIRSKIVTQLQKEEYKKVFEDWFEKSKENIFIRYIDL
jgi:peptidyl-prolyl cis-trans isomerase SurA